MAIRTWWKAQDLLEWLENICMSSDDLQKELKEAEKSQDRFMDLLQIIDWPVPPLFSSEESQKDPGR